MFILYDSVILSLDNFPNVIVRHVEGPPNTAQMEIMINSNFYTSMCKYFSVSIFRPIIFKT